VCARSKVEHPFHIIKNLFQLKNVRYQRQAKNRAHIYTLFGLGESVDIPGGDLKWAEHEIILTNRAQSTANN
jgi:hypothetical protein